MTIRPQKRFTDILVLMSLWGWLGISQAVDGVIEINQARAFAGGVTSGDTPGFPVILSRSGSYRLTGNLNTNSRAVTAILITADNVSVDLNGFTIACTFSTGPIFPVGCISAGFGDGVAVDVQSSIENTTVMNGVIRNMGGSGVVVGSNSRVENLHIMNNGERGIHTHFTSNISGNTITNNGGSGIVCPTGCVVTKNSVRNNGGTGIEALSQSLIISNVSSDNGGFGLVLVDSSGYAKNVMTSNRGGNNALPQVFGGTQIGVNICATNTVCP